MNDEQLLKAIDDAYSRAKNCHVYLGDEVGKATVSGQRAAHCAAEWMRLRVEARKRGLLPEIGA